VDGSIVFSWYEGNNTAPHTFRLLVRVGGVWYASSEVFTTPAVALTSFGTEAQLKSLLYDPAKSNWVTVSFDGDFIMGETPGTGTAVGSSLGDVLLGESPVNNLSGSITGFGVYGENGDSGTGNRRIDSFTIEAAPLTTNAPSFTTVTTSGGNVVLNATGGTPNASVRVLATSDLALPRSQWTEAKTAAFDASGNLIVSLPITAASAQFYVLQSP